MGNFSVVNHVDIYVFNMMILIQNLTYNYLSIVIIIKIIKLIE